MKRYVWVLFVLLISVLGFAPIVPRYGAPFIGGGCSSTVTGFISLYTWAQDRQVGMRAGIDENSKFCVDRQRIYFWTQELEGVDPSTFSVVSGLNLFATDKDALYYQKDRIFSWSSKDPMGYVKDIGTGCATNNRHVWCGIAILPASVDIPSFQVMSSVYSKDKNQAYYVGEILSGADVKTFSVLSGGNGELAEDVNNSYKYGMSIVKHPLGTLVRQ